MSQDCGRQLWRRSVPTFWPAVCLDSSAELVRGFAANVFMLTNCRDLA